VNAVLRRLAQDGPALVERQDASRLNTPKWLWTTWASAYGEDNVRRIAESHMREAPLDITVSADPIGWAERLEATILPTGTLRRASGGAIANMPGYDEGAWWVQDAAAAIPVKLFGSVSDRMMIDLCAAPGGKTAQLAAGGANVTAIDRSPRRIDRMKGNLARLSLHAETICADAVAWRPQHRVWGVLLDAPCTATGAIRRHPDVLHLKTPEDVVRLALVQERLLHAAIEMLEPGGTLVYCTCSLEPEEGPRQISRLLARGMPMVRKPIQPEELGGLAELITPDGDLRTLPCHLGDRDGIDGFFAARLIRQ
jgi:16S rRNA (cytosine967-C5)-methyltransferase